MNLKIEEIHKLFNEPEKQIICLYPKFDGVQA